MEWIKSIGVNLNDYKLIYYAVCNLHFDVIVWFMNNQCPYNREECLRELDDRNQIEINNDIVIDKINRIRELFGQN